MNSKRTGRESNTVAAMSQIRAVAFDMGGVLAADFWEALYFSKPAGLVHELGLDGERLQKIGADLARKYCVFEASEDDYWEEFARITGCRPTRQQLIEAEAAIWVDPSFAAAVTGLRNNGLSTFIISDHTTFWFSKLLSKLGVDSIVPAEHILVSWMLGLRKKSLPFGTYRLLSRSTEIGATLVIDDRQSNLEVAAHEGFRPMHYQGSAETRIVDRLGFLMKTANRTAGPGRGYVI